MTNNADGAKGRCGGHGDRARTREGRAGTTGPNHPRRHPPTDKVRQLQRRLWVAAKQSSERRLQARLDRIDRRDVLWEAWRRVKTNRGAAGVDRETLAGVEQYGVERLLDELHLALCAGTYRPQPVLRRYIPKADGRPRPRGIPTIRDRVAQMATTIVREPILEAAFRRSSYGFRPKRRATQGLETLRVRGAHGGNHVLDAEIRDYFGSIDHTKLLTLVALRISDRRVRAAPRGLELHPEKTRMVDLSRGGEGVDFLGCPLHKRMSGPIWERTRTRVYSLHRWPSQRAIVRVRARVRALTPRSRCHEDLRRVMADVNPVIRGWSHYFRTGTAAVKFIQIDRDVEERLRGLLRQRAGSRLRPGRADTWHRPFFEALGLYRLRGTIQYPETA